MFKLLSATTSPYARKVRIALAEKDLPFELVTEVPWDSTTSTPKYNPLEKLPVLILEDGTSLYESSYILQYLELKHPVPPLLPPDVDGVLRARKLEVLCDGVLDAFVLIFSSASGPMTAAMLGLAVSNVKSTPACARSRAWLVSVNGVWAIPLALAMLPSAPWFAILTCGTRNCSVARCTQTSPV